MLAGAVGNSVPVWDTLLGAPPAFSRRFLTYRTGFRSIELERFDSRTNALALAALAARSSSDMTVACDLMKREPFLFASKCLITLTHVATWLGVSTSQSAWSRIATIY